MSDKDDTATRKHAHAHGRLLSDFGPLMEAEKILLEAAARGETAKIGSERPNVATEKNTVRAEFLRFLLLGGDDQTAIHECGAQLFGAWVSGTLDLESTSTSFSIDCKSCVFTNKILLIRSTLPNLYLQGTCVPGIYADGISVKGCVLLQDGFKSEDTVRFPAARIGMMLDCSNAEIHGKFHKDEEDCAFFADGAKIGGSVFLRNGFKANGCVRLNDTRIKGPLDFSRARLNGRGKAAISADGAIIDGSVHMTNEFSASGEISFTGAQIGGDFSCAEAEIDAPKSHALALSRTTIKGNLFLGRELKAIGRLLFEGARIEGSFQCIKCDFESEETIVFRNMRVRGTLIIRDMGSPMKNADLSNASVGALFDEIMSWGPGLILDGFTYDSIGGTFPTNATDRIAWLDKQYPSMTGASGGKRNFWPQPWKQLQKTLRNMGHIEDARQVAIALEDRLRHADLIGESPSHWGWLRRNFYRHVSRILHLGFCALTGYGYRPMRLLIWMFFVWLCSAFFYWWTALPPRDVFAPSNPLVFQHEDYRVCIPSSPEALAESSKPQTQRRVQGAGNWYLCEKLRQEYTGFSPLTYSLDVLLPLVDLQQQRDWGPMIPTPKTSWWRELLALNWGHAARLLVWFQTLFGWVASLLLVAIVSGLTKRRED